jgi:uncharacterized membrane protein YeaQ/YmgE (transglycosylase-associated protein family)
MGIISWIIFGALAGWVASIITGRNSRMGCLANIVIGILGAVIGGFLMGLFNGGQDAITGFNLGSFIVAVIGAVLLLLITGLFNRRRF